MSKPTKEQKRTAKKRRAENHAKRVAEGHSKKSVQESQCWDTQVVGYGDKSDSERLILQSLFLLRSLVRFQSDSWIERLKLNPDWSFIVSVTMLENGRQFRLDDCDIHESGQTSQITIALQHFSPLVALERYYIAMTSNIRDAVIADNDSVFIDFASGFSSDAKRTVFMLPPGRDLTSSNHVMFPIHQI